jgi:catechol 2,3-dioxygenase-like lactoylglutathione lyase family enzyme
MRELFGPVGQIGYVVNDLEAAVTRWHATTGIGPWTVFERLQLEQFVYEGADSPVELSIAFAYSAGVQIELIQQHNDAPSMYLELLDTYGEGAQHICFYPRDYDRAIDAAVEQGMTVGQHGALWGIRFAYLRGDAGRVIEFGDLPPAIREGRDRAIAATAEWDGTDPIRAARAR